MEATDLGKFTITKLTDANYYMWSNLMEVYLRGKWLWKIVTGEATPPIDTD